MGTHTKVDAELFHYHFPGCGNHFSKGDSLKKCKRSWVYKHVRSHGPITVLLAFHVWNQLRCVLCCDWSSKNLNQSARGHSSEPGTFRIFWEITLRKVIPAAWKVNIKSFDQFRVDLSMWTHRFLGILDNIWLVTYWKIDSPIFFHLQGGRPIIPFSWEKGLRAV